MPSGRPGTHKKPPPNAFSEVLDELAVEHGIDRQLLEEFSIAFFRQVGQRIRKRLDFRMPIWGVFHFSKYEELFFGEGWLHGKKKKWIKGYERKEKKRCKKLKAERAPRIKAAREKRKERKIVNKLFLRKVANELDYVLALYH